MPVMYGLVHNVRDVARMTDAEARQNGKKSDALDNCGTLMQGCFRTALQATGEDTFDMMRECRQDEHYAAAIAEYSAEQRLPIFAARQWL